MDVRPHERRTMKCWLDFSGAPPLLIPTRLVRHWRGSFDRTTGQYSDLNTRAPHTDYDRACALAWPGRGILAIGNGSAIILYTEYDQHTWDRSHNLVACGNWLPADAELEAASWQSPFFWQNRDTEFLLMNSAADGATELRPNEFMEFRLPPGNYVIEYAALESTYVGCFHRFTPTAGAARSAA